MAIPSGFLPAPDHGDFPVGAAPTASEVVARLEGLWTPPAGRQPAPFMPEQVGPYRIERVIGHGTFGIVYLAHDVDLHRTVALKLPRPEVMLDEAKLRRFQSEARAAASLDHPGIVPLYEAQFDTPTPYLAAAYCPSLDLARWLSQANEPIACRAAAHFVLQLAEAVHYAHQQGVVHRDLKPSNILLVPRGGDTKSNDNLEHYQPRLTDFGLAKLAADVLEDTRSSMMVGTPLYMAPEQVDRNSASPQVDVYALGCLLYELLTGRTPVEGNTYVEVTDAIRQMAVRPLRELRSDTPIDLQIISAKCIEKDPRDRYPSAGELASDLHQHLTDQPIAARPVSVLERVRRFCRSPNRITQAGQFAVAYNAWIIAWLWISFPTLGLVGISGLKNPYASYRDVLFATVMFVAPKMWIGWKAWHHRNWAVYAGVVVATVHLGRAFASAIGFGTFFADHYQGNPAVRWTSHTNLLILGTLEVVMYLVAVYALRSKTKLTQAHPQG